MKKYTFTLVLFCFTLLSFGQKAKQLNSSEIFQEIKKLHVVGNVLYLAAHPDDENTRFISYCANEKLFNTAYLSLTRGDGGQNLIGTEIREGLGILRTQELLAARRTDGGEQFFTSANDFGYSKNPEETLEIWDKDKVLSDVVWVIRKFQPDVIVCRFPDDGGGGHGHHTSSAILAQEAFKIAGDSTKFPEQLEFLEPWQPLRVVTNTGRWWNDTISENDPGVVIEDIGLYNGDLGMSYNELAALSRSQHKSQGFGSTGSRGKHIEYFEHVIGKRADTSLFDGFNASWKRIEGGERIEAIITWILDSYNQEKPYESVKVLLDLRRELNKLSKSQRIQSKIKDVEDLIIQCSGLYLEAKASDFYSSINDSIEVSFEWINRSPLLVSLKKLASTELELSDSMNHDLLNNQKVEEINSYYLGDVPISQPYWLANEFSLGMYRVKEAGLLGKPENDPSISFDLSIEIEGEIINRKIPLIYKWNDPVRGELYRPFIITPKLTVNIDQPIYLFSTMDSQYVDLVLKSNAANQKGELSIELPKGWKAEYDAHYDFKLAGEEKKLRVKISPDGKPKNGELRVLVNGVEALGMNTIAYDHIPTQVWFPKGRAKLVYVELEKRGNNIAYVEGAGDVVPDALRNIGYQVTVLSEEDLNTIDLSQFDAILTGIRFFNVNKRSPFMAPKLLEYVENGGNLLVQYNTRHRMKTQDFGPYPIKLSRDRVTEEDSQVKFLKPDHKVLNTPNKISQKDFENWVQERGLYFPSEWDAKYEAILSWHDKGEDSKEGSLLVTAYGKGTYIYTGISFFRELPAGVPGAYRLLVNLISYGQE